MDYETVIVEKANHVASLILNRGDDMNVINQQLVRDINSALFELPADDDVRVIILKGAGKTFCAGMDIKEFPNKSIIENR